MPFVCGTDRGQTAVALPDDVPTITAGAFAGLGRTVHSSSLSSP